MKDIRNYNIKMLSFIVPILLVNCFYNNPMTLKLKGNADIGYYTVDVLIGTPP